ncbi:hypothetical protein H0484_12865 [Pusillimonas sp. CC-YST705]|uniref:Uncharacterized protein n=1 Tax=Mesopusillimonas faecipullorum TaxID=2755040 RepID=A0ABS8CF12_9BURK|nr:hypothetical protein [Mesopusillimonas faecipullorum]MCB5364640.1 hypothetical protein [Mesopusillimonas faecipullorum]
MRIVFVLVVLVNAALYGVGQGWLGPVPSSEGRGQLAPPEQAPERMVPIVQ